MSARVPALPLGVDPLIAEANERARRRRLLALGLVAVVAAAAVGTTFALRSSANALGVCATPPSGWQERTVDYLPLAPSKTIVLTNWRFGRMTDFYGLTDRAGWPAQGVTIAVGNIGLRSRPSAKAGALRVNRASFGGFEGAAYPAAHFAVRSQGRVLDAYIEAGALTPATIAAANQALAGVQVCSA
jgi:hypothetical protein